MMVLVNMIVSISTTPMIIMVICSILWTDQEIFSQITSVNDINSSNSLANNSIKEPT